jgi:integrase
MKYAKLTKRIVAQLAAPDPSGKQQLHWCGELRGFFVRVSGTTADKTYGVFGRVNGRQRFVRIGATSVLDLDDARERAKQIIGNFYVGIDPKIVAAEQRKKEAVREVTLRTALDNYLTARKGLRPGTLVFYRQGVEKHLAAWLDLPLRSISADMVEQRHRAIAREIEERRPGFKGEVAANASMVALRTIYNFAAENDDSLPRNPTRRLRRQWFVVERRTRMVRTEELATFYGAVDALPSRASSDVLKLMLFTGMRVGEATALRWSEIDFAERAIRLPAKRVKSKRPFLLPMSDFVADLMIARRAIGVEGNYVFPGEGKSGHLREVRSALATIAESTGIKISPHDLRRTYSTIAAGSGISWLELKKLLNHAVGGSDVTVGYVIFDTDALRKPVQIVCNKLKALCGLDEQAADVVRIRR